MVQILYSISAYVSLSMQASLTLRKNFNVKNVDCHVVITTTIRNF